MLTLRDAVRLLSRSDALPALRALLAPLGFARPLPVGAALWSAAGLDDHCTAAELSLGRGALRAMCMEVRDGAPAAEIARVAARRLAARATHVLWLVAVAQRRPACTVLSVPPADAQRPVATFVVDRDRIVDSDAEALAAMAGAAQATGMDLAVHERWIELLGREALNRRFYRALEHAVRGLAADARGGRTADDRAEAALLCSSRLLFLSFLQTKGWLDGDRDFLLREFDGRMVRGGNFHRRTLRPLFFGTLNTPQASRAAAARAFGRVPFLNGGLFAPARVERGDRAPELSDASIGAFLRDVLHRYRFTAREDRAATGEAAVDPEMLGRAFESLMASRERRASGTFYTPSTLAARVVDSALLATLERLLPASRHRAVAALAAGTAPDPEDRAAVAQALRALRVLDPACGSGAMLVHTVERLAEWHRLGGDERSADAIRRDLLSRAIFGLDRDATAVWLCELRLWLSVAVECTEPDPARVLPLPNLDRNIRVGDALAAPLAGAMGAQVGAATARSREAVTALATLRARYARSAGARKLTAARLLDAAERRAALGQLDHELEVLRERRRDLVAARRGRDLFGDRCTAAEIVRESTALRARAAAARRERRRILDGGGIPFAYAVQFADVMAAGGFTTVVGNPPWVRIHRIPPHERELLRRRFAVLRNAAWSTGASAGGAGPGFAGQADLAALFVERSLELLRPGGAFALLLPAKLWTALAGGGVRRLLATQSSVRAVEDFSEAPELFDAVTYPSLLVAERANADDRPDSGDAACALHRGRNIVRWCAPVRRIALDDTAGSPWLLLPPPARSAFDRLRRAGIPLVESQERRPVLGVKCGHNAAFLVVLEEAGTIRSTASEATVRDCRGRRGMLERALLRPVIRGEHVRSWRAAPAAEHIVWTHDAVGPLRHLPPHAGRWLRPHQSQLAARSDSRGSTVWWALHRTDGARSDVARVVWPDVARVPRALWLAPGDPAVPLNTAYVLPCRSVEDAQAITTLLNSPLTAAWLRSVAEPARGGYRRLFAWTVSLLPLPRDWPRARELLAPVAVRASDGELPAPETLLEATLHAYRIRRRDVEPLLEWDQHSGV